MRVLLASPHFPPDHVGGVEYYTARLAAWLQTAGHEPEVVSVEHVRDGATPEVVAVVDTRYGYPVHRLELVIAPEPGGFRLHWKNPALHEWIASHLSRMRADVIHLQSGYLLGEAVLGAARAQGVPAIVTLHDLWFICPRVTMMHPDRTRCSGPDDAAKCAWCLRTEQRRFRLADQWSAGVAGRAARLALRAWPGTGPDGPSLTAAVARRQRGVLDALSGARTILSPSHFVRNQLERAGVDAGRIRVVPYGLEPPRKRSPRTDPPGPSGVLRVGYFGQLAPHKGIHVLIAAATSLPSRAFELVLHGPEAPYPEYVGTLRRLAGGDARIRFAGAYANEEIDALLDTLDVIVVPSVWHENWPFVVLEAFRARVPVIASRVGGLPEMIRHDVDGLLFEPGSVAALAACLRRLLDDPSLLPRLRNGVGPVRSDDDEHAELLGVYVDAATSAPGTTLA